MAYKVKAGKWRIYAQGFNKKTLRNIGKIRSETIDTNKNEIFRNAKTKNEVAKRFNAFWNSNPNEKEAVLITKIEKVK
jgi:recombination DNA repair RAD52 pathway protein